jgi:diaminohydroxyphosphoribosylaminopyrimidine deaminase/5-amino-6-(5-phosphoribosylamino)uracil reductase
VRTAQEVPTLVICDGRIFAAAEKQNKKTQLEAAGVRVLTQDGKVCLAEVLRQLAAAELDSVLIEGGGEIHGSVLVDRLADYAYVYLAPKLLGGRTAPGPVGGEGPELMEQALPLQDVRISKLGEDYLFEGRLKSPV